MKGKGRVAHVGGTSGLVKAANQREGEGALVDVSIRHEDGATITQLSLADLPVPGRRFYASILDVRAEHGRVDIGFGQSSFATSSAKVRALLVIHVSPDGLRQIVETCDARFMGRLREHVAHEKYEAMKLSRITEEPSQLVEMTANYALIAFSGGEAVLDFYHSSAWSVHMLLKGAGKLAFEPVVRVDMPTPLLLTLLDEIFRIDAAQPKVTP